jgi:hypothetical protein
MIGQHTNPSTAQHTALLRRVALFRFFCSSSRKALWYGDQSQE